MSSYKPQSKGTMELLNEHKGFMKGVSYMITPSNREGYNQGMQVSNHVYRHLIVPVVVEKVHNGLNEMRDYLNTEITVEAVVNICNMEASQQSIAIRKLLNGVNKIVNGNMGNFEKGMLEMSEYIMPMESLPMSAGAGHSEDSHIVPSSNQFNQQGND